jgi:hypothetical protein
MRLHWSFVQDEDPYRGKPSVGFLQLEPEGPYQLFLSLNGWDFAWIAFFRERDKAQSVVDMLADTLGKLSQDTSIEGWKHCERYLEAITAQSEFPVPEEMDATLHEDLRRRHGSESGWRVEWPFSESPLRLIGSTFLGVWPVSSRVSGVWITLDAGNSFAWIALYTQALDAHWVVLTLEEAIHAKGGFATAQRAERLLLEAAGRSEFPVPVDMEEQLQTAIREHFQKTNNPKQHWETPTYKRDLSLFRLFYESNRRQSIETTKSMQLAQFSGEFDNETYDPYFLQKIAVMQRTYCLNHTRIIYLEPSALKMCASLCGPLSDTPDFPEESLWIQPLAPLPFRGSLIRGMWLYDGYNVDRLDSLPLSQPEERIRAKRYIKRKHGMHQVEIIFDNPQNQTSLWQSKTLVLGEYDKQQRNWSRMPEGHECLSGNCTMESLGDRDILVQCPECQEEFEHWTQWLQILFYMLQGKFRRIEDTQPFEELELHLTEEKKAKSSLKGKSKKRSPEKARTFHTTIVKYDASYFKPSTKRGKRGSLIESHIVLTTEEAIREGVMEVDMEGVLVRDFTYRAGFTRHLVHPRFKKTETTVKPKGDMPQLVTLATWKARQTRRMEAVHKQEDVYASDYE